MISVCIATYNGEQFIKEQLDSILGQLGEKDEIIVSDDNSTDETIKIIKSFNDERIKIFNNPLKGIIKNFENAILKSSGDYIFLADQDDIWCENKIKDTIENFDNVDLVISDATIVDKYGKVIGDSFFKINGTKKGFVNNIINAGYLGCAMAFKKEVKNYILPFPKGIAMHDLWIGSLISLKGELIFLDKKLILYRRHGNNASASAAKSTIPIFKRISYRIEILILLMKRVLFNN